MGTHENQADKLWLDISAVRAARIRARLRDAIQNLTEGEVDEISFWRPPESTEPFESYRALVVSDLASLVKKYRETDPNQWIASVRIAKPYFVALVRTGKDRHYAGQIDNLVRHTDARLTVCDDRRWFQVLKCLHEAISGLDPYAISDVKHVPTLDKLLVTFSDGLPGFVGLDDLGIADLKNKLLLHSATVARDGAVVAMLTTSGDLFDIDSHSIRALIDRRFAAQLHAQKKTSAEYVGTRIRAARKERGLSQVDLGNIVHIDQAILSKIERGLHSPRIDTIQRIARGLQITLSELFASADLSISH